MAFRFFAIDRTGILNLTREQRAAAEACGCVLIPASEEQVRRLTMQRRVFRLDGEAVLATRDGGCFETRATLAAMMAAHAAVSAERGAEVDGRRSPKGAGARGADPTAATGGPGPSQVVRPSADPTTPVVDPNPMPVRRSLEADARAAEPEGSPGGDTAASAIEAGSENATPAGEADVEREAAPIRLRAARTPRQRRAGEPKTPRWVTAGKERRGRLK